MARLRAKPFYPPNNTHTGSGTRQPNTNSDYGGPRKNVPPSPPCTLPPRPLTPLPKFIHPFLRGLSEGQISQQSYALGKYYTIINFYHVYCISKGLYSAVKITFKLMLSTARHDWLVEDICAAWTHHFRINMQLQLRSTKSDHFTLLNVSSCIPGWIYEGGKDLDLKGWKEGRGSS